MAKNILVAANHTDWFALSSCLKIKWFLLILLHEQTWIQVFTHSWITSERIYSETQNVEQKEISTGSILQASFKYTFHFIQ